MNSNEGGALLRAADTVVTELLPLARRLGAGARHAIDEAAVAVLGRDFAERMVQLDQRYAARGGDPFGFDPETARYALLVAAFFHRLYFRVLVDGIARVPAGRVLLVSNHSGQLPLDGMAICTAMVLDAPVPRMPRAMVEKWAPTLPFVGTFFARCGQVVGVPENCRRLLELEEAILVFPEGVRGISKPFSQRYHLARFGLGFMRLAIETGTPIVPIAVVGAEEQYVNVGNLRWAARALGLPVAPVIPQMFLPGGLMPLPTRYRLYFGEPLHFDGDPDDEDAVIERKVEVVTDAIEAQLARGLEERKGIFS